ncbi:cytochrome P450 4F22 [Aplysia californica]|uniref:Cytochrome P450 4F22 n=1 Tax=Aplysia californica TaxID=6500 RepID=A0ABM0JJ72_APLCA|nr:cytochrome P450 4F22 [Aplysia californica]XP_005094868.1 cytochrome P450 4F22 [Aplysia californica]
MWLETVIAVVVGAILWRYLRQYAEYRRQYFILPGHDRYSYLYGSIKLYPGFNEEGLAFDMDTLKRHKYLCHWWAGPVTPVVSVYHPDSVHPVLKSSAPKPRSSFLVSFYDMGLPWLGEGLILSNGSKWAKSRRLLTPAFHFDILKPYMAVYNSCANTMLTKMEAFSVKEEAFELFDLIDKLALDVILQCAFSYQSDCQTSSDSSYTAAIVELVTLWGERTLSPLHFNDTLYKWSAKGKRFYELCKLTHQMSEQIIAKRIETLENADETELQKIVSKKTKDFLDILLLTRTDDKDALSPVEIRNEVDTFLFAGHDTTASGISWTLYSLTGHPEYQEKVYQEVKDVMGDRDTVQWTDLASLEFTTMCIKEAMRMYSTVPSIIRTLEEQLVIHGHRIPKGSMVAIQLWMLHHNPHVWEEPLTFDPNRFHPDKQCLMDPFQFLPFSAGARNCIGQNFALNEMKVTVAKTIKRFRLSLDPSHEVRQVPLITMKPENGLMIQASPR